MPQEFYIVLVIIGMLLLYLLYRLKIMHNDITRLKRKISQTEESENHKLQRNVSDPIANKVPIVVDDNELIAVLTAAIMAYECKYHSKSTGGNTLPAHGFIIRRVVRSI